MAFIQIKQGSTEMWLASTVVLQRGEPGWDWDTDEVKIGDGVRLWAELSNIAQLGESLAALAATQQALADVRALALDVGEGATEVGQALVLAQGAQLAAEQAAELSLAGQFVGAYPFGTANAGGDVNTLLNPGRFRFSSAAGAASTNLPPGYTAGVLDVSNTVAGGAAMQVFTPYGNNAPAGGFFIRRAPSTAASWVFVPGFTFVNPSDQPGIRMSLNDPTMSGVRFVAPVSTDLGNVDLDLVTLPGSYRQNTSSLSTLERHYPIVNFQGTLEVLEQGSPTQVRVLQRATAVAAAGPRYVYRRRIYDGVAGDWVLDTPAKVEETAGRVATIRDAGNNRDQMIYGDTGWRNVSDLFINGWSGAAYIRRNGGIVSVKLEGLDPSARTAANVLTLPPGFRGGVGALDRFLLFNAPINAAVSTVVRAQATTGTIDSVSPTNAGILYGSGSWPTNDTWPTSLPGTAVGTIPNL